MLRSIVFFAAKGVIRDANTNNISAFSILESLQGETLPFFIQELGVFAMWRRDAGDPGSYELQFVVRNNEELYNSMTVGINFDRALAHRTTVNVGGIVVREAGKLSFEFRLGDEVLASYVMDVTAPPPGSA